MPFSFHLPPLIRLSRFALKWGALASLAGVFAGAASAIFLIALTWATHLHGKYPWLLALLPVAGFAVGWLYLKMGPSLEGGNNLLIDEIHDPTQVVPLRMAPMVLFGTVISHLFGASVGREGTAVQMGGSLADQLTLIFRLKSEDRSLLLMAGISAGFASVFGTPLAGAVFGLEVLVIGRLRLGGLFPCLIAAVVGHEVGILLGIHHTPYPPVLAVPLTIGALLGVGIAGALFGLTGRAFAFAVRRLSGAMRTWITYAPLRPFIGGIVIAALIGLTGGYHYTGLGIPTIQSALSHPLAPWDWLGKLIFTVMSLGSGFKGGEVTPLFYIGATLGNALAPLLHLPFPLLAALGFVAVFAGAANTPLASTLMAMEIFGPELGGYACLACVMSYLCAGKMGIYHAQRRP